jgi:NAD+ diphosphatase
MRDRNTFAGPYLDRAAHLREDPSWFRDALADAGSRVLPVWNMRNLIAAGDPPRAGFLTVGDLPERQRDASQLILLGNFAGRAIFAVEFDGEEPPQLLPQARFDDLRMAAPVLPAEEAGLLSYARAMVFWRKQHRFCGVCGMPTVAARSGHVVICTNPVCQHEQFPRTDPAIIVLVSDGERALLGRQASWPPGRYSTIAGFVEPGESLEDAVAREVGEETGIEVDAIEYHSSQPWPFPSSLMLGFSAHAKTTEIKRRDQELEDAQWFTRAQIIGGYPKVPPSVSISYRLLEHWFDAAGGVRLRDVQTGNWPPSGTPS